jgi:SAM-dependent methyltransferase
MKNRKKLLTALNRASSNLDKTKDSVKPAKIDKNKIDKNKSKLAGAKFRWINEKLYTISSQDALQLFKCNPDMFSNYHDGFDTQVKHWPQNPVDIFISRLRTKDKKTVIADMGCGTAKMAKILSKEMNVHSFDLSAANDFVTIADIAHVPLEDNSADVVVFSLSLMGVNYMDFLIEAHRILKNGYF